VVNVILYRFLKSLNEDSNKPGKKGRKCLLNEQGSGPSALFKLLNIVMTLDLVKGISLSGSYPANMYFVAVAVAVNDMLQVLVGWPFSSGNIDLDIRVYRGNNMIRMAASSANNP